MRVLIFTIYSIPHIGGLSVDILIHAKRFKEAGHKVDILSINTFPKVLRYFFIIGPAVIADKYLKGAGYLWKYSMRMLIFGTWLLFYYKYKKWDVIFTHDVCAFDSLWGLRLMKNFSVKTYLFIHDYWTRIHVAHKAIKSKTFIEKFSTLREMKVYQTAQSIITVDSRLRQYVLKNFGISSNKVSVITNSTDIDVFRPLDNKFIYRELFGLPKDKFIILVPRRLVLKNGVEYAILAATKIKKLIDSHFILTIAGSGSEEKRLKALVRRLGISDVVLFLGSIIHERMPLLYNASDCVVIPSINIYGVEEATSLSALEAMSCSLPVIASNIGGLKEIITDNVTGKLIPSRDVDALAEAILCFFKDKDFRLVISSRAREFSIEYTNKIKVALLDLISNQLEDKNA